MRKIILMWSALSFMIGCGNQIAPKSAPSTPDSAQQVQANGTINGGGGVGLLCGDKLELLDVYEARQAGLTLVSAPGSVDEAVTLVSSKIAAHFWNVDTIPLEKDSSLLANNIVRPLFTGGSFKNVESGKVEQVQYVDHLDLSNDYGSVKIPAGCQLEQIAYYSDDHTQLSIVRSDWDKMDWISKSALITHELIYLLDRRDGLESLKPDPVKMTSVDARKFVGQLLSTESLAAFSNSMPTKDHMYHCTDTGGVDATATYFYAFDDLQSGKLSLVFNSIFGRYGIYQTRADFSSITLEKFIASSTSADVQSAPIQYVSSGDSGFSVNFSRAASGELNFQLLWNGQNIQRPQIIHCDKF